MRAPARPARSLRAAVEPVAAARASPVTRAPLGVSGAVVASEPEPQRRRSAASIAPSTTPSASGPPPRASDRPTIARPSATIKRAEHARGRREGRVARPYRIRAPELRRSTRRVAAAVDPARGVDDHPAGPLAQHGLERLAEQRPAGTPRRQRHHQGASMDLARLLDDPPAGLAGAHLLPVARSRGARRARVPSRSARRRAPPARASRRRWASSVGTVIVTSTWMPRRRRAASRAAVATASWEKSPSSKATSTDSYSTSCSTTGLGITTLWVSVSESPWRRR